MRASLFLGALCGLGLLVTGCGEDTTRGGTAMDMDPATMADSGTPLRCTAANSLCADLSVPDDFAQTPSKIIVGLYESLPPQGPPLGILAIIEDGIELGAGMPHELTLDDVDQSGNYFVYVALYNEGGGTFQPVPGVDYIGTTASKVSFKGDALNLGAIELKVAE